MFVTSIIPIEIPKSKVVAKNNVVEGLSVEWKAAIKATMPSGLKRTKMYVAISSADDFLTITAILESNIQITEKSFYVY